MKRTATMIMLGLMVLCMACTARAASGHEKLSIDSSVGVFAPKGEALDDVVPLTGVHMDWQIDDSFGLRLGYEYAESDVSDGSKLTLWRVPVLFTTPERKRTPLKNMYMGFGVVSTFSHYSDSHYPDVNKLGPAMMLGWNFAKNFNAEVQYDALKRYGRNYGGFSFTVMYDGL